MKEVMFWQFLVGMILLSSSQIQGEGCNDSGIEVVVACGDSIDKEDPAPPTPSEGCCTLVRLIGMKCVCQVINKRTQTAIDMQKLVKVAAACGRPLASGSQCGSYHVPGVIMSHHV